MKEIKNLQLTEFQKEIINKLDDEYCYKISFQEQDKDAVINIIDNDGNFLLQILSSDDYVSIKERIKNVEKNTENINGYLKKELNRCKPYTEIIENNKKTIKLLELILKENK
ncbi:hypothetical protein [Spiroplasma citri]|uniref:Uncharacterized protein n=1 Tax=Spiroplasma citri TaxID=2133 RepID=A0AAJ4JYW1_SPICI|nr:hypothetical protein [Spiroplasma citri]APE74973.1 hypothetical protein SCITRI_001088 [Spiroplasma citri]QIA67221.1 hypothetical protein GMI18_05995 [Spiroplasma citri]QIA69131.1 hypothetical protein GL298_06245 [Spiroplasma citri]QIA70997.1 hypothetical protein GL981_06300 [Spiroplasma citri]QIA72998.1 hypothetical protein GL982_04880 [Spiroplasma citri]